MNPKLVGDLILCLIIYILAIILIMDDFSNEERENNILEKSLTYHIIKYFVLIASIIRSTEWIYKIFKYGTYTDYLRKTNYEKYKLYIEQREGLSHDKNI